MSWLARLFPALSARRRAREAARRLVATLHAEPIIGTWVCADEATRFVVRVFYGARDRSGREPPWKACAIVAVDKGSGDARLVEEDEAYRPTVR